MTVITISRELGSDGAAIAAQVADRLDYQLVSKNHFEKILQQYGMIELDALYKSAPGFWARVDDANLQLISMLNKSIRGIARRGNAVILGRGGFAALGEYSDVLHVRLQAPFSWRVQRILEGGGVADRDTAVKIVRKNDKARRTFIQAFYNVDWDGVQEFNLVFDTRIVSKERAIDWIVEAAQSMSDVIFTGGLTTADIQVDPILESTIEEVLQLVTI